MPVHAKTVVINSYHIKKRKTHVDKTLVGFVLEQFQRLYLEFIRLAQKESSSDCALFRFRCLIIFNIKPWLARPVNLIQTIKPFNQCHSNTTQRELGHVPAAGITKSVNI